jgi:hypothetical protein
MFYLTKKIFLFSTLKEKGIHLNTLFFNAIQKAICANYLRNGSVTGGRFCHQEESF